MIIQCAWCREVLGKKEPYGDESVTHTICKKCSIEYLGIDLDEVEHE